MPLLEFAACLIAAVEIREPLVPLWAMELGADIFLGAWLFFVGASVGSFLNVVVYRLPRGINLVYPPSRCPSCLHPIRLRDNVPVLSWLLLAGKCRDCRAPVSSRYFWIELLMGTVFLGVWLVEANLMPDFIRTSEWIGRPRGPQFEIAFWCAYALHVLLLATILGGALIRADRFRTPPLLFLPILLAGFVLPLLWPEIRPLPAWPHDFGNAWQAGAVDGLAGIGAGALLAVLSSSFRALSGRGWPNYAPVALLTSVGAVLGWQLTLLAAPAVAILYLATAAAARWLGPLPCVPPEPAAMSGPSMDDSGNDPALGRDTDNPPAGVEPPFPAIPSQRDLSP